MGWISKLFKSNPEKKKQAIEAAPPPQQPPPDENQPPEDEDGQERGPAGKGYVETKGGTFGRKKRIETNLGPDGKPVYTGAQLETAMERMKTRKKAREQAKKEEKAYVEYRKAEILRQFQPKVGTLRLGDEAYPKRRRVGMGFGERKAHYLAIRPKPKYATWIGRKKGIIEAKPHLKVDAPTVAVVTDHSMLPDHSTRAPRKHADHQEHSQKMTTEATKENTEVEKIEEKHETKEAKVKNEKVEKKDEKPAKTPPKKREPKYITTNKGPANPIRDSDKAPFWCGGAADNEELNDDDLPVDMEILEKVCSGEKVLSQRPFNKAEFLPFGPIAVMKQDDVLFVRDTTLFANTVESVISLQPEDDKKKKLPPPFPYKLKWSNNVRVVSYHPNDSERIKSWIEEFHMVTRDKTSSGQPQPKTKS